MTIELLPRATCFVTGADVELEVRARSAVNGQVLVEHLGEVVASVAVELPGGGGIVDLGPLPRGGYAVTLVTDTGEITTALDVLDDVFERPRYGFLSDFPPGRSDVTETIDDLRRLHLNVIQFYDWMFRHEDLLGEEDDFTDALGRSTSHATTRAFVAGLREVGAVPMGYAAVYGVSNDYAAAHPEELLYRHDATPWSLGDFLQIVDPSPGRSWLQRFCTDLRTALEQVGFVGFHLDQYGWPKLALRHDGTSVDLSATFPAMLTAIRDELPDTKLIFNNVNDFPTSATAGGPQDAVYIEVWSPHDTYGDLASLIERARRDGRGKPVILAAYMEPYRDDPAPRADAAAQLAFATIAAHGAHHLLCGERGGVLVDPYYPAYHRTSEESAAVLRRLFDGAVALGDLLHDDGPVVTDSWFGGINEELRVDAAGPVSGRATPGSLWTIVRQGPDRVTVHLIDLAGQQDIAWNLGKEPLEERRNVRVAASVPGEPNVVVATPLDDGRAQRVDAVRDGQHVEVTLPPFTGWAVVSFDWAVRAERRI